MHCVRVHETRDGHCMSHDTVLHCFRDESCLCCHGVGQCGSGGSMVSAAYDAAPSQII